MNCMLLFFFMFLVFSLFQATFNPKNKGRRLHRHPAFFGTIHECIEDCCEVSKRCKLMWASLIVISVLP